MEKEYRAFSNPELRSAGNKLVGYAAKFNVTSHDERILPGAFANSLRGTYNGGIPDIRALVNHDSSKILGRTTANTLRLHEDSIGLHIEIDPPDNTIGKDTIESVRRGDWTGMSFGLLPKEDRVDRHGVRELMDVELTEVSIVTFPWYPQTEIDVSRGIAPGVELRWYRGDVAPIVAEPEPSELDIQRQRQQAKFLELL